jgi:CMP-N,N'-diacetyllegionaminic acid synthase
MKIVTVILARGGSKGIPKKNIIPLNDKPLIYYTINASINSKVNETWVCTDDEEIANVSKQYGANVLIRPKEISGDNDKSELALLYFLEHVKCDLLVFIQPTSPLVTSEYINNGINKMLYDENLCSVFSVCEEHWLPRWSTNREPINWDIDNRPMRQDVPLQYVENGAFYISKSKNIIENSLRYGFPVDYIIMNQADSLQVDTYDDLDIITKILRGYE